jgi:hypothetical protein
MKMAVFWVVASCRLSAIISLMMEAGSTSETLVNLYQSTQCYNPENTHLPKEPELNITNIHQI